MAVKDMPIHKALHFDLKLKSLVQHYSETNPKGGYARIRQFLKTRGYEHEQYSGYHSIDPTTDMLVFDMVYDMQKEMPWLGRCINKFEVTNIGENYDLTILFPEINSQLPVE